EQRQQSQLQCLTRCFPVYYISYLFVIIVVYAYCVIFANPDGDTMPCSLKHFPCISSSLNLTRRTAVPQSTSKNIFSLQRIKKAVKPATEVYLLPVVILL